MQTQAYIAGAWVDSEIGKTFPVLDPGTGEVIAEVADCGRKLTSFAIESAADSFKEWRKRTARERGEVLLKIKNLILNNVEELATIMSKECVRTAKDGFANLQRD